MSEKFWHSERAFAHTRSLLLLFGRSVVSSSLRPHGLELTRLPGPSLISGVVQTHVHGVGDAIQAYHPLSAPSPPVFSLSQHQGLFQ